MQLKLIAVITVLLLLSASLLVSGCTSTTNSNQAANSASPATSSAAITKTTKAAASVKPSASASIISPPAPTAAPTTTVKPLKCYHVEIIIYHNMSNPCNTCSMTGGMLVPHYANNPYWSMRMQNVDDYNGAGNLMVGVVKETGETTTFGWGEYTQIQAWSDAHLLCYPE
jgi:hypothetical protein